MDRREFANIISGFEPDGEMKARLESKILSGAQSSVRSSKRMTKAAAAAVFAAALMCGITVSAMTLGWTEKLFGSSAEIIAESPGKYSVEIGNIRTEGCTVTTGGVISDGESLYISLFAEGLPADSEIGAFVSNHDEFDSSRFSGEWITLDDAGNYVLMINPENGVKAGDRFDIILETLTPAEDGSPLTLSERVGFISFTVESEVNPMANVISVEDTAVFTNNYTAENDVEDPYGALPDSVEFYVESVKISPLKYTVNGSYFKDASGNDDTRLFISPDNIFIIYKNGEIKEMAPDCAGGSDVMPGCSSDWIIEKHFKEVIDIDNAEAVWIGDLIVPIG